MSKHRMAAIAHSAAKIRKRTNVLIRTPVKCEK
jgi:hypothetical protein